MSAIKIGGSIVKLADKPGASIIGKTVSKVDVLISRLVKDLGKLEKWISNSVKFRSEKRRI